MENGWEEYKRLVLEELKTSKESRKEIKICLTNIKVEIAKLKVKSGIWGAIAGAIPATVILIFWLLKNW